MFGFIYSVVAYTGFLAVFTYFVFFTDGILVPKHIDSGEPGALGAALLINLGLVLLFGLQHSIMARKSFKDRVTGVIPKHLERSTFVMATIGVLVLLMAGWQPIGGVLWHVEHPVLVTTLWTLNAVAWAGIPAVSFMIDHFDLFGLKAPFENWRKKSFERKGFVMPWLYRYCRHPMMVSIFVAFWATPHMSVNHALFALGMSGYIYVGVYFEERSLVRELGETYTRYQDVTPKFIPRLHPTRDAEVKALAE